MPAAVSVQQHPPHRPPRPTQPVRPTAPGRLDDTSPRQRQPGPGVAPLHPVAAPRILVEMADAEALVTVAVKPADLLNLLIRHTPRRHPSNPAVPQSCHALIRISHPQPQKVTLAAPQNPRRLRATQTLADEILRNLRKALHPYRLRQYPIPAHPKPPVRHRRPQFRNRTNDVPTNRT